MRRITRAPNFLVAVATVSVGLTLVLAGCATAASDAAVHAHDSHTTAAVSQRTIPQPPAARRLTPCARWSIEASVDYLRAFPLGDCQGGLVVGYPKRLAVHVGERVYFGDGSGTPLAGGVTTDSSKIATAQSGGSSVLAISAGVTDIRGTSGIDCVKNGQGLPTDSCVLLRLTVTG